MIGKNPGSMALVTCTTTVVCDVRSGIVHGGNTLGARGGNQHTVHGRCSGEGMTCTAAIMNFVSGDLVDRDSGCCTSSWVMTLIARTDLNGNPAAMIAIMPRNAVASGTDRAVIG